MFCGGLRFVFAGWAWLGLAALASAAADEPAGPSDPLHLHLDYEEIIVTASPLGRSRFDVLQGTASLSDDKLEEDLGGNIGETLDHLPGVSQSYFGPGAGRPIIRGLGGDRIRILIGGIGTFDASSTSPDHGVAVDPLTAQSIEVIRGPATLLYGNNAVGGVVNIRDGRIPFRLPEGDVDFKGRILHATNGDEESFAAALDLGLGEKWVLHADGSVRDAGDIAVPGFLRSAALRDMSPLPPDEEPSRRAENTSLQAFEASAGVSRIFSDGFAGVSIT
ncbi:MAG TPA: TonB-dependent receptor plug domain-containing protein, partial [Sphingomonadales bacterium]|nr:TonB-dependent receptor plug domain-containing protein [Sphingomonadales bacterium]